MAQQSTIGDAVLPAVGRRGIEIGHCFVPAGELFAIGRQCGCHDEPSGVRRGSEAGRPALLEFVEAAAQILRANLREGCLDERSRTHCARLGPGVVKRAVGRHGDRGDRSRLRLARARRESQDQQRGDGGAHGVGIF
jgi:hypothetical protein